jgi:glycerate kinase
MRALIVFDKFKDAIGAAEAGMIAARAIAEKHPGWQLDLCPLTDGGEGFCDILTRAAGGETETVPVTGPRGAIVRAPLGFVALAKIPAAARALLDPGTGDRVAVIEMASASGLALLSPTERDPWQATTLGTGELIRTAAARDVAAIVVGVGGSATNDLGLGALAALGLECQDAEGRPIRPPVPARWGEVARLVGAVAMRPPVRIACDVTNPLLGSRGATAIYGPQKGLRAADLPQLESAAGRLARMLLAHCGRPESLLEVPGTGAAGGISFGLMAATDARLLPGFELVTAWLGLESRLAAADVVITGEGRFDDSSLTGKGPGAIAARALALGKRVHVFAGAVTTSGPAPAGLTLHAITPTGTPLADALRATAENLTAAVQGAF